MPRKKLLFVTDVFPYPLDRGQHVRVLNVLEACGRACDVTFVGPAPERDADRERVDRHCARSVYLGPLPRGWRARAALSFHATLSAPGIPRPRTIRRYEPFVAALRDANPESFDLIWAERPHIARLCAPQRGRTILDLDDLEHVKIVRLLKLQRSAMEQAHMMYRYVRYRHLEVSWARRFLASVVCSEEDRLHLASRGCRNALVVPNAPASAITRTAGLGRRARDPRGPLRVVFLGNVTSEPNLDAIDFFASEVLPVLRARDPKAILDVIGPNASPEIRRRYGSRVRFRGFVDDLGAALGEYDVLVAPLRFGGGTKLKVLDAMAHRIPIVTTPVGAEGLALRHGEHVWLGETAAQLAEGIERIKLDRALGDRLTANAQEHVRENFSWETIKGRLTDWLQTLDPR